jgi:hypothetical protein
MSGTPPVSVTAFHPIVTEAVETLVYTEPMITGDKGVAGTDCAYY